MKTTALVAAAPATAEFQISLQQQAKHVVLILPTT